MNNMNKILIKLKFFLFPQKPFFSLPNIETQTKLCNELKKEINNLPNTNIIVHSEWDNNITDLKNQILNNDPVKFIQWPIIRKTMFHICNSLELKTLKKSKYWNKYKYCLRESSVGNPPPYPIYPSSSGNLIHNAFNLHQLISHFNIELNKMDNIVEFGGGYGAMLKLIYSMGFSGNYTIFDLPVFSILQKYYLSMLGIYNIHKVNLTSTISNINSSNNDLCIMMWSLSEAPLDIRQMFLEKIGKPKYFLIAYQIDFSEVDNVTYFKKMQNSLPEYQWIEYEIPHLRRSSYLIGKKIINE